ncbi:hypothetical protein T08_9921, partial [Trichinella sp. T8]
LLAAPSTVPFSQTSKTQPVFPDTFASFRPGEFNESRATLNRMDSAAHHAVSDWIHLYGGRHETLSLLRPPFWFLSSHLPCRALDLRLVQQEGEEHR